MMIGNKIRALRQQRNLTIDQLAPSLGLIQTTLSKYERNEREPDFETTIRIANYFNVSIDWLLGRVENPKEYAKTDMDYIELLKYNNIINKARVRLNEANLHIKVEDLFEQLLEISLSYGLDSAIEILKLQNKEE